VPHAPATLCVKLVKAALVFKVINAPLALEELIWMAKLAKHVQIIALHVQALLCAKLVKTDLVFKAINVRPALLEHSSLAKTAIVIYLQEYLD